MRLRLLALFLIAACGPAVAATCAPADNSARILRSPSPNDTHPDWRGESTVGTSWSFDPIGGPVTNATGSYLKGDLISPRGQVVNRNVYVVEDDWECEE